MRKLDLLALQVPTLPKSRKDAIFRVQSVQYIVRSRVSSDGKLLIVAFYNRESAANGFSLPSAVLYQGKEQYITHVMADGTPTWRESKIFCALKLEGNQEVVCMTAADEQRVISFLRRCGLTKTFQTYAAERKIPMYIDCYQSEILEKRLVAQKKRVADMVDQKMKEVPKLPKSFDAWIDRWPLLHSRYGYYKRFQRNAAECFCTHCKSDFIIRRSAATPLPTHDAKGECPLCHAKITFKAKGRTTKLMDHGSAAILQRTKKGEMLLRFFNLRRYFMNHYQTPETVYEERGRLFLSTDGQVHAQYKHGWSAKTGRVGWYQTKDTITGDPKQIKFTLRLGMYVEVWNVWFQPSYLYHYNLRPMLTRLNLSYDIKQMVRGQSIDVTSCILRSMVYPYAPSLHRIGLTQVRADLLDNYLDPISAATSGPLHARFGVPKEFLTYVRQERLGMKAINLMATLAPPPKLEEFIWFYQQGIDGGQLRLLRQFTTYHKIIAYLSKQIKNASTSLYRETKEHSIATLWKDYLEMCETLDYDRSKKAVLFPKNVRDEHDKLSQLIKVTYDPKIDAAIQKLYPALQETYQFQNQRFLIRPPRNFDEFVQEGVSLLHCVCTNGYYRTHIKGERLIFFIRSSKNPDTPLYTLEYNVKTQNNQQIQGYRNKGVPQNVKQFADLWLQKKCRLGKSTSQAAA